MFEKITVQVGVNAPLEKVWQYFIEPEHITVWNHASDDWHCPRAENNLVVGGSFNYRMEAKDSSFGFDFEGTYTDVIPQQKIVYILADERKIEVVFEQKDNQVEVTEIFDAETVNPIEMQRSGWQSILDNFKQHAESL